MIDLEREIRALLAEDVRTAPPAPAAGPAVRRARRRQAGLVVATAALFAVVAVSSIAGVSLFFRSSGKLPVGPVESRSPSVTAPSACPNGSSPNEPGPVDQARPRPRSYYLAQTAFDAGSDRLVMLTVGGSMWTFDVCTNRWTSVTTLPPAAPDNPARGDLVYDVDSGRLLSIGTERTWVYDAAARTWTAMRPGPAVGGMSGGWRIDPLAVYDPLTGHVVVYDPPSARMWSYDVDVDEWTRIDDGVGGPPAATAISMHELLAYDASVDRLVLYIEDDPDGRRSQTWAYDLRAGRWQELDLWTPYVGLGWVSSGDEIAYDEANAVSVIGGFRELVAFDAAEGRWRYVVPARPDRLSAASRLGNSMAYDPVNDRLVFFAGGGRSGDAVWGFDVATRTWTEILAPTEESR